MRILQPSLYLTALLVFLLLPMLAQAAGIDRFIGTYVGAAELVVEGEAKRRDLSTTITKTDDGFSVMWQSTTYRSDGRTKEKTYEIEFVASQRAGIYSSAMKTNIFGKATPLDPLKGEPFVWSRLEGDTLAVFSLFINEEGGYEMQEYHRTLAEGGLDLMFRRVSDGVPQREIMAFLERQ